MDVFYKGIANHVEIKQILKEYEVKYDKEKDIEFFDELITGILEDHVKIPNRCGKFQTHGKIPNPCENSESM